MGSEAKLLQRVNSVNVGPKFFDYSKNFVIMEFVDGKKIGDWINSLKGRGSSKKLKSIVKEILENCFKLDQIGVDHGELNNISKHVIVGKNKSTLIDFESASTKRRPSNVTSITQAIFISSVISKQVQKIYKITSKEKIIKFLRIYKQEQSQKNFDNLLKILKL